MKLLFCADCWDVFKLESHEMRACKCGKVKGRYLDTNGATAMVSKNAFSIAIGNESLISAIEDMKGLQGYSKDTATRDEYYKPGNGKIEYAWVRPNTGPGNPYTRLMEEDDATKSA